MKKHVVLRLAPAVATLVILLASGPLRGQIPAVWNGGPGVWSSAPQWNTGTVPNNEPGTTYVVAIDGGKTAVASDVTLDLDVAISGLTIDTGDRLGISDGRFLTIEGDSVVNNGTIAIDAFALPTGIRIVAPTVTFSGTGEILLFGVVENNRISGATGTETLVNGNRISGAGTIADLTIENSRALVANINGAPLVLDQVVIDADGLTATNGGILVVRDSTATIRSFLSVNANSRIDVEGSTVSGGKAPVAAGGQLTFLDSCVIRSVGVDNTFAGTVRFLGGNHTYASSLYNLGLVTIADETTVTLHAGYKLTNNGTIKLNAAEGFSDLRISGTEVTLDGFGTLELGPDFGNRILGAESGTERFTNYNRIRGSGQIGVNFLSITNKARGIIEATRDAASPGVPLVIDPGSGGFINEGTLQARDGGILELQDGVFTNTAGTISMQSKGWASTLTLRDAQIIGGSLLVGGTLSGGTNNTLNMVQSSFEGSTFENFVGNTIRVVSGENTIQGTTLAMNFGVLEVQNGAELQLPGAFSNNGTIFVESAGTPTILRIASLSAAKGTVSMSNNANNYILPTAGAAQMSIGSRITGSGQIGTNSTPLTLTSGGSVLANQATPLTIRSTADGFSSSGLIEVAAGSTMNILPGYRQSGGSTKVNGTLTATMIDISKGSLTGDGLIQSDVRISGGVLTPGLRFAELDVAGDVTFTLGGSYLAELATDGGSDRVDILGTLSLGTSQDTLTLSGGMVGLTYIVATYQSRSGIFDQVTPGYQVTYDDAVGAVLVAPVPEPTTIASLGIGVLLLWGKMRRRGAR